MERAAAEMGDNVYLVDLPGDFDTSSQTSVLLRHALTKAFVLRNAASVRLVMMLSCEVLSVKRGASVEDDLADVLNLFPDSQTQSCMLTLVSPVGRDSLGANLRNLTEQSTIGHIRSIRCEVEGLTRGRECTQTTSFFTKLNASLHETELALQAGRAPTSPICYAANPLRGDELDTVRASLNERKLIERAKGLLMAHRHLSEEEAHKTMRQMAMNQNRRLIEVAEAVLAMADVLPERPR